MKVIVFLALLGLACGTQVEKNRPVTKVVNMLKDMAKQLEKEAEEDEDVYDKVTPLVSPDSCSFDIVLLSVGPVASSSVMG